MTAAAAGVGWWPWLEADGVRGICLEEGWVMGAEAGRGGAEVGA